MSKVNILTNNRDRNEFKIRVYDGLIAHKINKRFSGEAKRLDCQMEGILPFKYIDKDGIERVANSCIKGSFILGENKIIPGVGAWCATKVDSNNYMVEWGYCIDLDYKITNLDDAKHIVNELLKLNKPTSFIIGYLKTYIIDRETRKSVLSNHDILELLRNKELFPDVKDYKLGETIVVKGQEYILEESVELGIHWNAKDILVKKKLVRKKPVETDDVYYGTNRAQEGDKLLKSYRGIIDEDINRFKRGSRTETVKKCISKFDYINQHGKRVTADKVCIDKDMTIDGTFIGPGGGNWCATELDDTGLMREWGYCIKGMDNGSVANTEKSIWEKLCTSVRYEQWNSVSKLAKELLLNGYTEKTIFNNLLQICNKKKVDPFFKKLIRLVNIEFIKLYPWMLIKTVKPNIELYKIRSGLLNIIHNKLEYLQKTIQTDLVSNLASTEDIWLLNYYCIVERLIVLSIVSDEEDFNVELLGKVKKTLDLKVLNAMILTLETKIKKTLQKYISDIEDNRNILVDLNVTNVTKKGIDPKIIITNYSPFFGNISPEKRTLYYSKLDLDQPIALQIAFYNKSFVEPKELMYIEDKQEPSNSITNVSSGESSNWYDKQIEYYSNYPELSDPEFYVKLHRKKEFQTNKMDSWKNKKIEDLCRVDVFELAPQQQWVSNFFNIDTPYKGLLLYWGTGVGKTCASITITERHIDYYKKYNKKILVILGTSTMQNYIKELYNFNKEKIELRNGLIPGSLQCTGDKYYIPIEGTSPESMKIRENRILKKIEQDYEFITYGSLKGIITKLLQKRGLKLELDADMPPKNLPVTENEEVKIGNTLFKSIKTLRGFKWVGFVQHNPQKEERIRLALSDYFSNRLVIVDEIQNIRTAGEGGDQIAPKMLEKIVHYSSDLKLVLMSATPMFNNSTEIVYILNLLLENDGRKKVRVNELFDSQDNLINPAKLLEISRGYISYVRGANPISFPRKLLPNESPIPAIVKQNIMYYPKPINKMNRTRLNEADMIKYNPLVRCDMSKYQEAIFNKAVLGETMIDEGLLSDTTNETFDINGKMISNIVYPLSPKQTFAKVDVTTLYGEKGFDRCFVETKSGKYEYNEDVAISVVNKKPIIDMSNLNEYSPKFHKIIQNIMATDNGIIFIYSEYKKGGSLPMALTLEQNGFDQVVVDGKMGDIMIKNKLQSKFKSPTLPQKWKYVLLDGDMDPKKRSQIVQRCNSEENKDGNVIKVIIGTRVTAEGIDFARIRQIHIINPWDNFSRIDQTIGRGIRNCSHKDLPVDERNVTIFLYSSHIADNSVETTDEKIHRRAERKDIQMKEVEFTLRNGAVDCLSHYNGNKYSVNDFGETIGDKDNTRECGYKNCNTVYNCVDYTKLPSSMTNANMDKDTYNIEYHANIEIDKYNKIIKSMFLKDVSFKLKHIKMYCQMKLGDIFDENIFFVALDKLIINHIKLYDKYNRIGRVVFRDGYYLFQPNDLDKTEELPEYYRKTPLTIKPSKAEIEIVEEEPSKQYTEIWYKMVIDKIDNTEDPDVISYYLDRVKDSVMKMVLLDWFRGEYNPKDILNLDRHRKLRDYLENKDVIIYSSNKLPKAIHWSREISYEYLDKTNKIVERVSNESLQKPTIVYNFDDYNLETHVIGRLEFSGNGKEESPLKNMTCKIIDFSFVENKANLKLDGKACMSYNRTPMDKIMKNLGLNNFYDKRELICEQIELALRKYNREKKNNKVWWIESNKFYRLEKLL